MTLRTIGRSGGKTHYPTYNFSGRAFYNTATNPRSVYSTPIYEGLLLESPDVPPDLRQPHLLKEDGGALCAE